MIQVYLGCKIILHVEILNLANYKPIQENFALVLEIFSAEKSIVV